MRTLIRNPFTLYCTTLDGRPTPQNFTSEMNVEVDILRLDILFSKPPPPLQYDLSPRWSPAANTGLDEPGVSHNELQQTEQEITFPFQTGVDGFLHVDCVTIPE